MSCPAYEAWILAKIRSQQPVNAVELAAMSEPWRTLAEKLAATPAHEQGAFLEGYPDRPP